MAKTQATNDNKDGKSTNTEPQIETNQTEELDENQRHEDPDLNTEDLKDLPNKDEISDSKDNTNSTNSATTFETTTTTTTPITIIGRHRVCVISSTLSGADTKSRLAKYTRVNKSRQTQMVIKTDVYKEVAPDINVSESEDESMDDKLYIQYLKSYRTNTLK